MSDGNEDERSPQAPHPDSAANHNAAESAELTERTEPTEFIEPTAATEFTEPTAAPEFTDAPNPYVVYNPSVGDVDAAPTGTAPSTAPAPVTGAASEPLPAAVGSKYIPPALNEPDAAARVAASAAAARAAARAVTAARLAAADPNARLSTTARPAPALGGSEVALRSAEEALEAGNAREASDARQAEDKREALRAKAAEAVRAANAMPFTSSNTVIDRSQYVVNAAGEKQGRAGNGAPATSTSAPSPSAASAAAPFASASSTAAPSAAAPSAYVATPTPADGGGAARQGAPAQPRVVYVEAPTAPVKKGNRGFGSLVVLLSAVGFAVLFALVIFALFYVTTGRIVTNFLGQASFFVPVVLFVLGFLVLVLIANRAGWWAYVLGSIAVGAFTYAATIGVLLLLTGVISSTPQEASADLARAVVNPLVIAAGVLAREVSLWTGWAISVRGRRVAARNKEQAEAFQRDLDDRDHNFAERNAHDLARADQSRASQS